MAKRHSRKIVLFAAVALLVLAAAVGVAWRAGVPLPVIGGAGVALADTATADGNGAQTDGKAAGEDEADPAVPVEVASVARRSVAAFHRAASSVEADRLVDVTCRAAGRVREVAAEEGDWVEAGTVLAELDNARQKVELRRAELRLAEQQRKRARAERMLAEQLISEEEFDAVQATHDQALADRDLARITVEETYVKAPFTGQVTARAVVAGQMVQAGQAAFTVADFSPLRVRVYLPEPIAAKVRTGETVKVETETGDGELTASVERISPVVDPSTGTVQVTLRLPEGAEARVGGFVKARLTTDRKHDVLAVPKLALVEEGGLRSVFVAEADTVRKVEVTTGLYDETHVEVVGGLQEGWAVVTLGRGGLRTGTRIEILPDSGLSALASR
jgi:RND family efflux transporter MFP subunit